MGSEWLEVVNVSLPKARLNLVVPLLFALGMAWTDARTNRIPNYLTLACTVTGLGYQLGFNGLTGLGNGLLGMTVGFGLLILFYWKGGLGAGDVKALAALGAWVGPKQTLFLFVYMALSGVLVIVVFLWWRGLLLAKIRQLLGFLLNLILAGAQRSTPKPTSSPASAASQADGIPYALALALGMAVLCWQGFGS
jgi:prepilin peptidase CpaA